MRAHFKDEQGSSQGSGGRKISAQGRRLRVLADLPFFVRVVGRGGRASFVSDISESLYQLGNLSAARHGRALGCEVDRHRGYARHRLQRSLHPSDARGAGHALDRQIDAGDRHRIPRRFNGLDEPGAGDLRRRVDVCAFSSEIDPCVDDTINSFQGSLDASDAGGACHTFDWNGVRGSLAGRAERSVHRVSFRDSFDRCRRWGFQSVEGQEGNAEKFVLDLPEGGSPIWSSMRQHRRRFSCGSTLKT